MTFDHIVQFWPTLAAFAICGAGMLTFGVRLLTHPPEYILYHLGWLAIGIVAAVVGGYGFQSFAAVFGLAAYALAVVAIIVGAALMFAFGLLWDATAEWVSDRLPC